MHIFVLNKFSGSYSTQLENQIKNYANIYLKGDFFICYTRKATDQADFFEPDLKFKLSSNDTLVAVGGDGTINLCLSYLYREKLSSELNLGIIPRGTGNNLLKTLNLSKNIKKSIKIIAQKNITKLQFGIINKKHPFINCSLGFSAFVLANRKYKSRNGYALDVINNYPAKFGITSLKTEQKQLSETIFHGYFINSKYYASFVPFLKENNQDQKISFFYEKDFGLFKSLSKFSKMLIFGKNPFKEIRAKEFWLTLPQDMQIEIDGDLLPQAENYHLEYAGKINFISAK